MLYLVPSYEVHPKKIVRPVQRRKYLGMYNTRNNKIVYIAESMRDINLYVNYNKICAIEELLLSILTIMF